MRFLREPVCLVGGLILESPREAAGCLLAFLEIALGALNDLLDVDGPLTVACLSAGCAGQRLL